MLDHTPSAEVHTCTCPNCGRDLVLATRIRRAFGDDLFICQCALCGITITKTAGQARAADRISGTG